MNIQIKSSSIYSIAAFLLILMLSYSNSLLAQEKWSLNSIYLNSGVLSAMRTPSSAEDFKLLSPNAAFFSENSNDFSSFPYDSYFGFDNLQNYWVGFEKSLGSKQLKQEIRIGFTMGSMSLLGRTYTNRTTTTIDTLISAGSGTKSPVDSIHSRQFIFNYSINTLMLDVSYLVKGRRFGRWSFYAGAGLGLGFNYNTTTSATYNEYSTLRVRLPEMDNTSFGRNTYERRYQESEYDQEQFANQNSMAARFYIPLGVSLQLGKKNNFWKHIALFAESAPGLFITSQSELNKSFLEPHTYSSLGLRIDINP